MIAGLGAFGAGGGYSASSSASSTTSQAGPMSSGFWGIQTGGSQGIDITTLAVIGAVVVVALLVLRKS